MLFGEGPQIKNIAADLNKLFRQGSLLNQSVQNVEGDSTADQGTSDLLAARDPVIQEISVGMSGEQAARYTVSGTPPLSLPNSLGKPLKAWSVDVVPYQDLHGYSAPWPAGGGTNLIDYTQSEPGGIDGSGNLVPYDNLWRSTQFIKVDASTDYTICMDSNRTTIRLCWYDSNKNFLNRTTGNVDPWTDTSPSNAAYVKWTLYNPNGITESDIASSNIQMNKGSTIAPYAPYSNICPIYGTDKLNLFVEESYDQSATPKAVLTLPSTVYSGSVSDGGAESRFNKIKLSDIDASNWDYYSTLSTGVFRAQLSGVAIPPDQLTPTTAISTALKTKAWSPLASTDYACFGVSVTGLIVITTGRTISTVSDFLDQWGDIEVCYPLATFVHFPLTTPTIPTPTGTATTWATAEDGTVDSMEVTYVGKA